MTYIPVDQTSRYPPDRENIPWLRNMTTDRQDKVYNQSTQRPNTFRRHKVCKLHFPVQENNPLHTIDTTTSRESRSDL